MKTLLTILFSLLCLINIKLSAQNPYQSLYLSGQFEQCLEIAEQIKAKGKATATDHFYAGAAYLRLDLLDSAESALNRARELDYQPKAFVYYHLGMLAAQRNESEIAFRYLDSVSNFSNPIFFPSQDSLFAPVKGNIKYAEICDQIKAKVYPCTSDPRYTKLDFWLGNWEVFVDGIKRANSEISKPEGECILYEQYNTVGDFKGQSANFYDPETGGWHQIWITYKGKVTHYYEVQSELGFLWLETAENAQPRLRMTYELKDDGNVQQLMYIYDQEKSNWKEIFKGIYKPRRAN